MESFKCADFSSMSDEEIEEYALKRVLESGDPSADPQPMIDALKNMPAIEKAMEDPYWSGLVSIENYRMADMNYDPLTGEVTPTEETK